MALANFFDKTALAASQILQGYDRDAFEGRLNKTPIEIAFDSNAVCTTEGKAMLNLSVSLLSRLYPVLSFKALDAEAESYCNLLKELAKSINPDIELIAAPVFATVVVGKTKITSEGHVLYIGSDEWMVHFSREKPIGCGESDNPFGAGVAACFGAANVFRAVFKEQLLQGETDKDFSLSLLDFTASQQQHDKPEMDSVDIGEAFLVGLGAIGNGALWALSKVKTLKGSLYVIDHEKIELSNLQRYVLATQADIDQDKVELCGKHSNNEVFKPFRGNWADFLTQRGDWNLPLVAVAVDSAEDRIAVQSSLPKYLLNAWTQQSDLGVSRHFDFVSQPCIACLYLPKKGLQSKSELIAGALGLPEKEIFLRELIYNNSALSEEWIREIATAKQLPFETLAPYIGTPITSFYSNVLCGSLVTIDVAGRPVETPMVFQSALAGILLASEIVQHATGMRKSPIETMTRINLLQPVAQYLNDPLQKTESGNCICHDSDFKEQYNRKYNVRTKQ